MTTPTDDNRELLTVVAYMRAKPGKRDGRPRGLIEPTAQEGYVNYDLHQGSRTRTSSRSTRLVSGEHLDATSPPAPVDFADRMGDWLDESGLTVNRVRRIA